MDVKSKIKERLNELGIRPSKGLGQNFLISESAYEKIVKAAEIEKGERVLEIGPGLGTLTEYLAAAGAQITAVEKDRKLIEFLNSILGDVVKVVEGDVLEIRAEDYGLKTGEYKVVANIPYYISSRLLRTIFESWPQPKLIVLLLQHEVAQRVIAKPPHMNILAISVQYFAEPKIMGGVPRGSFYPVPKVDSSIVRLTPHEKQRDLIFEELFFKCVKIGFSSKRKKLVNNLAIGLKINKEEVENTLEKLDIPINCRPENLTITQWQELAKNLG